MTGIEKIREAEIELKKLNEELAVQKVKVTKRTEEVEQRGRVGVGGGDAGASERQAGARGPGQEGHHGDQGLQESAPCRRDGAELYCHSEGDPRGELEVGSVAHVRHGLLGHAQEAGRGQYYQQADPGGQGFDRGPGEGPGGCDRESGAEGAGVCE